MCYSIAQAHHIIYLDEKSCYYIICSHLPVLVSATHCGIKISTNLQELELPIITKVLWFTR